MKKILVVVLVLSLFITGCGSSKEKDIKELSDGVEKINWDKAIDETMEELSDSEDYPYVEDLHIELNEEEREILFTAALTDSIGEDIALEFADTMIRRLSSIIAVENSDVKGPEDEYLGEIFDYYNIAVGVAPISDMEETDEWYVLDRIKHESHRNAKLNK